MDANATFFCIHVTLVELAGLFLSFITDLEDMALRYEPLVALHSVLSISLVAWRMNYAQDKHVLMRENLPYRQFIMGLLQPMLQSSFNMALLANLTFNFIMLFFLLAKDLFFGNLSLIETQNIIGPLIDYALFKVLFLILVAQPDIMNITLWLGWFTILGLMKVFRGLAKDRLEQLNASPTATILSHGRVFSVLVIVLLCNFFCVEFCILRFMKNNRHIFLLLLFEPVSIGLETIQAIIIYGIQFLDTWQQYKMGLLQCAELQSSERSVTGATKEWKGSMVRNCSFVMDLGGLVLALCHCLHIWWLRCQCLQLVDGLLFLYLRNLLSSIYKRIQGFIRLRTAIGAIQGVFPDATKDELLAYDDDCAICKETMIVQVKRLPCEHLFHLHCIQSWLDQGMAETYSCPICRGPLFTYSRRIGTSNLELEHLTAESDNRGRTMDIAEDSRENQQLSTNRADNDWRIFNR